MPRFTGRHSRGPRRRPNVPAIRIRTGRAPKPEHEPEADAPVDAEPQDAAAQPADLVPSESGIPNDYPTVVPGPGDPDLPEEPTLGEYIERIEASAARLRAEHPERASDGPAAVSRESRDTAAEPPERRSLRRPVPRRRRRARRPVQPDKPWYRRKRTWIIAAIVLPLLVVAGTAAYSVYVIYNAYEKINVEPVPDRVRYTPGIDGTPAPVPSAEVEQVLPNWDNDDPINIVLLGVDVQTEPDQPPRSDTTIVMQIRPATNEVTMMSIPRDLIVLIPGHGENKFNAAYPIGEVNEGEEVAEGQIPGGGPTLVAQTIEANFGIFIHYFATVDFDGFRKVVDTVGGVVIYVPTQLTDNQYPTDDLRLTRIYFPTGLQKMDGDTALQYVRTRHADSDFGRAERQQQVLMAIREQATTLELFKNAQSLIRDMQDTVRTDLNFNEMMALANLGRQVNPDDIARFNLFEQGLLAEHFSESEDDPYYIEADWDAVRAQTQAFFGGSAPDDESVANEDDAEPDLSISVFVENATEIPLLAGSSAQLLADAGFVEVWPSDARALQSLSTIQASPGQLATARHIAQILGFSDAAIQTVNGSDGITVTLGEDVPPALIPDPDDEPVAG